MLFRSGVATVPLTGRAPSPSPLPAPRTPDHSSRQRPPQTRLQRLPRPIAASCPSSHEPMLQVHRAPPPSWIKGHLPSTVPCTCPLESLTTPLAPQEQGRALSSTAGEERKKSISVPPPCRETRERYRPPSSAIFVSSSSPSSATPHAPCLFSQETPEPPWPSRARRGRPPVRHRSGQLHQELHPPTDSPRSMRPPPTLGGPVRAPR